MGTGGDQNFEWLNFFLFSEWQKFGGNNEYEKTNYYYDEPPNAKQLKKSWLLRIIFLCPDICFHFFENVDSVT